MTTPTSAPGFAVRPARPDDLPTLADFEVEIARISFGDDAVDDRDTHFHKLRKALHKSPEGMFVAARGNESAIGWLWMALNINSLTGARYVNFRSLATSPGPDRGEVAEALLKRGLEFARDHDVTRVVGKVHVGNVPMRALYHKYGFQATHLTMELSPSEGAPE